MHVAELWRCDDVERFDGTFALDCSVVREGTIRVGDEVELRPR